MGWWSTDIMGGDSPLDFLSRMGNVLGIGNENSWTDDLKHTRQRLEATPEAERLALVTTAYHAGIAAQVMAYVHMRAGASLPDSIRQLAVDACVNEHTESWSDPAERTAVLQRFATQVLTYDNCTSYPENTLGC